LSTFTLAPAGEGIAITSITFKYNVGGYVSGLSQPCRKFVMQNTLTMMQ